jgi:hypothetical protein
VANRRRSDNAPKAHCPACTGKLVKFLAALRCEDCDRAWFILQTSSGEK